MANTVQPTMMAPPQSNKEDLVRGFQEMTFLEFSAFVHAFAEQFDPGLFGKCPNAEGSSLQSDGANAKPPKTTPPRWHELRATSLVENPYPVLAAMREQPPVVIGEFGGAKVWYATRDADIRTILTHPYVSNDFLDSPLVRNRADQMRAENNLGDDGHHARNMALSMEDQRHLRVRPVLAKAMNSARSDALRPFIEFTATELLDSFPEDRHVDLLADFGVPLATKALARFVGIPEGTALDFPQWCQKLNFHMLDPEAAQEAGGMLYGFCASLIAAKRNNPGDDAITDFIQAQAAGTLSEFEMLGLVVLTLHAGQEAHGLFANGLFTLLRHPDQLAKLQQDWSLLQNCLDELLRYESSLKVTLPRHTNAPVELDGITIPARDYILISLAAANRDPARHACPEELDITRKSNPHLAFGHGSHRCTGARFGSMVSEIALRAVLTRFPQIRLALQPDHGCPWRPSVSSRRLESLPVILGPRAMSS